MDHRARIATLAAVLTACTSSPGSPAWNTAPEGGLSSDSMPAGGSDSGPMPSDGSSSPTHPDSEASTSSSSGSISGSGSGFSSGARLDSGVSSGSSSGSGSNSGSSSGSGASDAGAAGFDGGLAPGEVTRVAGWLSNTGSGLENYAYANINTYFPVGPARDKLVNSIVGSCAAFGPPLPNWQMYCEAIIGGAIVAESSYIPGLPTPGPGSPSVVYDAYATQGGSNDPTVGLLQIRFSSTVHDFNYYGPLAKIAAIGCAWPSALTSQADVATFWRGNGGTASNLGFMEDPACNIPLATWYYFLNATGNGGANAVYAPQYCQGNGIAGNVVIGLISHLMGPGFSRPADPNNAYPAGIKMRFTRLLGGLPSPDPFGLPLSPIVTQYCK